MVGKILLRWATAFSLVCWSSAASEVVEAHGQTLQAFLAAVQSDFPSAAGNVLVAEKAATKEVRGRFVFSDLASLLGQVSWVLDLEVREEGGVYLVGGRDSIIVIENNGVGEELENVLEGSVRFIDDKIVITSGEHRADRVLEAVEKIKERKSCRVRLAVVSMDKGGSDRFGAYVSGEIAASVSNVALQELVYGFKVEYEDSVESGGFKDELTAEYECLAGKRVSFFAGETLTRVRQATVENGQTFVAGFEEDQTGLGVELLMYADGSRWLAEIEVEDSRRVSQDRASENSYKSTVELVGGVQRVAVLNRAQESSEEKRQFRWLPKWFGRRETSERGRELQIWVELLDRPARP